ncbi:MAG: hypothetical protein LW850_27775 [Planctomycetaceae bacterium]|jgi:hypothetical protein|nr:hypothetical protein [Planctomycetaceae bacterium]MCE2814203.1 hypothetical protein [Planctomycetaceae bacterium]
MARRSSNDTEALANVLRLLPAKWLIGLLVAVVLYFFLQPRLNQWFGWNLPSIAAMAGNEAPKPSKKPAESKPIEPKPSASKTMEPKVTESKVTETKSTESKSTPSSRSTAGPKQADEDYKFRILKSIGRDRYESPAGLIYAPGSEEGHRLAHIARHLEDQPNRPGSHGVFDGDMASFLIAIDDAYKRARGHAKGTKSRVEDGMTVIEAPFDQTIGYLGGSEGARKKNPKLKKMRLVVRDRNLITAFPIQ